MRPAVQGFQQVFVLRLVGANGDRAVRRVLQTLLQTGIALERDSVGVVQPEREPVPESTVERRLERMVRIPELRGVLVDVAQAAKWPQQVGRVRRRARHCAGSDEGRILVLWQVRGAKVHGVEVDRRSALEASEPVVSMVADVGDVERRGPRHHHLHAAVPLPGCGDLGIVLNDDQGRDADCTQTSAEGLEHSVA